ncbi:hypothetical protein Q5752_001634 [Cryptotrichosporon argae]
MLSSRPKTYQTPLPTSQIAVLMGIRLAEPIAYTVIFPFINQMVEELGVTDNPDRIGYYSGIIESVFALVQFLTVFHWARLSDRIGRKPVILMGLGGVFVSGSLFGLSTRFWAMVLFRCLWGALNGNVAVVKASLGDITDATNSTDAFAMYGLTWTIGSIIGNAIGGWLAHPAEQFPRLFGNVGAFKAHPYFLPCLVSASCALLGLVFCALVYRESLPSLQAAEPSTPRQAFSFRLLSHRRSSSLASIDSEAETLVDPASPGGNNKLGGGGDGFGAARREWAFWDLMALRDVQVGSATLFLNSFVSGAWGAASLLFFFDKNHGLGMTASSIGGVMALNGLWSIVAQLYFLTRIRRALGLARAYKALSLGWVAVWVALPALRAVMVATEAPVGGGAGTDAGAGPGAGRYAETRAWPTVIAVNALLSFVTFVGMANSLLMVLVNASAPDKSALGAVNGISTAVGCMARVIGPSLVSALFAISVDGQVMHGRLWWLFMVLMSALNFAVSLLVAKDKPPPTLEAIVEDDEDGVGGPGGEGPYGWAATPGASPVKARGEALGLA